MKTCTKCLHAIPHPMIPSMCIKKHIMKKGSNDKCEDYAWVGDGSTYTYIKDGKKVTEFTGQNEQFEDYRGMDGEKYVEDLKSDILKSVHLKKRPIRKFIRKSFYKFINLFRKGRR